MKRRCTAARTRIDACLDRRDDRRERFAEKRSRQPKYLESRGLHTLPRPLKRVVKLAVRRAIQRTMARVCLATLRVADTEENIAVALKKAA